MAFQIIKISNFLWKASQDPLAAHPIGTAMIHGCLKNIPILHTQKKKVGQSVEVLPMKVMHTPT